MIVEYDGTAFAGWQLQPKERTVQGELEKALQTILQEEIRVTGAGRTDAGAHARGQVAHFDAAQSPNGINWTKAINSVLPEDVVVREVAEAKPGFNARFAAKSRSYEYRIHLGPTALDRTRCWPIYYELDFSLLERCAALLSGQHDFSAFCSEEERDKREAIVFEAGWKKDENFLYFDITASRFLRGMVRMLVGAMVEVARGFLGLEVFQKLLQNPEGKKGGPLAPPFGLFLMRVEY
ncbi:MAG: tRNA pseudouridine(38-40) synthase TruA [Limisphaerales bacterium]